MAEGGNPRIPKEIQPGREIQPGPGYTPPKPPQPRPEPSPFKPPDSNKPYKPLINTNPWGQYEQSTNMCPIYFKQVLDIDGHPIASTDWVGAFISNNIRGAQDNISSAQCNGICAVIVNSDQDTANFRNWINMGEAHRQAGGTAAHASNQLPPSTSEGQPIEFRIWDMDKQVEYKAEPSINVVFQTGMHIIVETLQARGGITPPQPNIPTMGTGDSDVKRKEFLKQLRMK